MSLSPATIWGGLELDDSDRRWMVMGDGCKSKQEFVGKVLELGKDATDEQTRKYYLTLINYLDINAYDDRTKKGLLAQLVYLFKHYDGVDRFLADYPEAPKTKLKAYMIKACKSELGQDS